MPTSPELWPGLPTTARPRATTPPCRPSLSPSGRPPYVTAGPLPCSPQPPGLGPLPLKHPRLNVSDTEPRVSFPACSSCNFPHFGRGSSIPWVLATGLGVTYPPAPTWVRPKVGWFYPRSTKRRAFQPRPHLPDTDPEGALNSSSGQGAHSEPSPKATGPPAGSTRRAWP